MQSGEAFTTPRRMRWRWDDLVSSDGHRLHAVFACAIAPVDDPTEQKMLRETFGENANPSAITEHFNPALRNAIAELSKAAEIQNALDEKSHTQWIDTIIAKAKSVAFSCGLEILPPFRLDLHSPTLEQSRFTDMLRTLQREQTDDQIEQFRRAGELMQQFHSLRETSPSVSPAEMLKHFGTNDQPIMMKLLQMGSAKENPTRAIWILAGSEVWKLPPPHALDRPSGQILLSSTLGPLRSIAVEDDFLLVGAQNGVMIVEPDDPSATKKFLAPPAVSQFGFSRALVWRHSLFACHRDFGLVEWKLEQFSAPANVVPPSQFSGDAVRLLQKLDDEHLIFAAGRKFFSIDSAGNIAVKFELPASPIAILPIDQTVVVALEDGLLCEFEKSSFKLRRQSRPAGKITAAAIFPWLGSSRMLLAMQDGAILCVGLDDPFVTRFTSLYPAMSNVVAAGDLVAAVSADRQRLIYWQSWDGTDPILDVHFTSLAKHRIADIALG